MALDKSQSVFEVVEKVFPEAVLFHHLSTIRERVQLVGRKNGGW